MEIILAVAVVSAVIFFGALISVGNERQRKAIDDLREQTALWAIQDLRIKRAKLAGDVKVDDPMDWLNRITNKASGNNQKLQMTEVFGEFNVLVCATESGTDRFVFTTTSPDEIRRLRRERRNKLSKYANRNPLLSLPRHSKSYGVSVLNGGTFFDLELSIVWKHFTGQSLENVEQLWMYFAT